MNVAYKNLMDRNSYKESKTIENELNNYQKLNKFAQKNKTILFGSSFAKELPIGELKQSFELNTIIYNRSISNLSIFHAKTYLNDCIFALAPQKILLHLGETDIEQGIYTISEIITTYQTLIQNIKTNLPHCTIIIVSVYHNKDELHAKELNLQLELLAKKTKCQYADISPAFFDDAPSIKAFSLLKFFLRDKITFTDAMTMITY